MPASDELQIQTLCHGQQLFCSVLNQLRSRLEQAARQKPETILCCCWLLSHVSQSLHQLKLLTAEIWMWFLTVWLFPHSFFRGKNAIVATLSSLGKEAVR